VSTGVAPLAIAYFVYFGAIGIFTPFWSPYLELRGFDAVQIGLLLAIAAGVRAVGPFVFGWLSDATRRPTAILRLAAALSVLAFAFLPFLSGLIGFAVLTALFYSAWSFIPPSLDAHTLARLGATSARYGRIRLWGSLGFIALSWIGGAIFERLGYTIVPVMMMAFMSATLLATLAVAPMQLAGRSPRSASFKSAVTSRAVLCSLLVSALIALSFGPYYTFFSLYLERFGYSRGLIGFLWALGVLAEIGVFAAGGSLLSRYSIRGLFITAAAGTGLRWLLIALFPDKVIVVALAQLLHCLGFAVLHFAIVLTAQGQFPPDAAARGQALFSSIGYGVGGMLGSLMGGVVWTAWSPQATYLVASVVVVLAAFCAALGLRGTVLDRVEAQTV
jgi:PPP family 3-phenylpropionic acid transporter